MTQHVNGHHQLNDVVTNQCLSSFLEDPLTSSSCRSLFNTSKYSVWYAQIILKALTRWQSRPKDICAEKHHIIPKSIGGPNAQWNYAFLTPREHFICHRLLEKMTITSIQTNKMRLALRYMIRKHDFQKRLGKVLPFKSRLYLELREAHRAVKLDYWSNPINRQIQSERVKAAHASRTRSQEEIEKTLNGSRNYWSSVTEDNKKRIYDARKKTAHNRGKISYYDSSDIAKFGLFEVDLQPAGWVRGDPNLWGRKGNHKGVTTSRAPTILRISYKERRERNVIIAQLHAQGKSIKELSEQFDLHEATIKRLLVP